MARVQPGTPVTQPDICPRAHAADACSVPGLPRKERSRPPPQRSLDVMRPLLGGRLRAHLLARLSKAERCCVLRSLCKSRVSLSLLSDSQLVLIQAKVSSQRAWTAKPHNKRSPTPAPQEEKGLPVCTHVWYRHACTGAQVCVYILEQQNRPPASRSVSRLQAEAFIRLHKRARTAEQRSCGAPHLRAAEKESSVLPFSLSFPPSTFCHFLLRAGVRRSSAVPPLAACSRVTLWPGLVPNLPRC